MTASYDKWSSILEIHEKQNHWAPISGSYTCSIDPAIDDNDFPSILPVSMKIAAKLVGNNLVNVAPLGGLSSDELQRIKGEVTQENRDRAIDSVLEGREFKPMKIEEHPDYGKGLPIGSLIYMDYQYGSTSSSGI